MNNGMNFLVALKKWHTALIYKDKKAFQLEKEIDYCLRGHFFLPVARPFISSSTDTICLKQSSSSMECLENTIYLCRAMKHLALAV